MRDQCLPSGWEAEKGMADVHQCCKFTVRYITASIQVPNFISREIGVLSLRAATRDRDRARNLRWPDEKAMRTVLMGVRPWKVRNSRYYVCT